MHFSLHRLRITKFIYGGEIKGQTILCVTDILFVCDGLMKSFGECECEFAGRTDERTDGAGQLVF